MRYRRNLAILLLIFLSVCTSSVKPDQYRAKTAKDTHIIYVVNHGWHTGLVIPADALGDELEVISAYFDPAPYFELGWGDTGFYQADEITTGLAIKALLWPTDSVMHVVALPTDPKSYFINSDVVAVSLSSEAIKRLTHHIANSFEPSSNGRIQKMKPGLYGQSLFFIGNGTYHGLNTCNTWTADVLVSAGVPIDDWVTLTATSVMAQTRRLLERNNQLVHR